MSNVYLVIREGVYKHYVLGAYTEETAAVSRAKELAKTCIDGYHKYIVYLVPVDVSLDLELYQGWEPVEEMVLHQFSKNKVSCSE